MPSVFQGGQVYNGGFRADQLRMTFGGLESAGFLIQNVQFQYAQQVTLLYEIGTANVYYVGGRAQGAATFGRVVGPAAASGAFITRFNDICNPGDITMTAAGCPRGGRGGTTGGVAAGGGNNYTLQDAVLTTLSTSVQSQDVVINEQLQFIFADLEID